jgi:tripartite-type tricarboxylate transporter receptor subunit TctC
LGQPFTVVNVTGGANSFAATQVKDSKNDGYTMLCIHEQILVNKQTGIMDFSYEAFEMGGIGMVSKSMTLITNGDKFKNMDELIAYAKKHPGEVIAATEWGGTTHQALLSVQKCSDIELQLVDAGTVSERTAALVGGHIDLAISPLGTVKDYITTGKFISLLMFNNKRIEPYMDIPIVSEYGIDYVFNKFFSLWFSKGTDTAIVQKTHDTLKTICNDSEFIAEVKAMDLMIEYNVDVKSLQEEYDRLTDYSIKYPVGRK